MSRLSLFQLELDALYQFFFHEDMVRRVLSMFYNSDRLLWTSLAIRIEVTLIFEWSLSLRNLLGI